MKDLACRNQAMGRIFCSSQEASWRYDTSLLHFLGCIPNSISMLCHDSGGNPRVHVLVPWILVRQIQISERTCASNLRTVHSLNFPTAWVGVNSRHKSRQATGIHNCAGTPELLRCSFQGHKRLLREIFDVRSNMQGSHLGHVDVWINGRRPLINCTLLAVLIYNC